MISCYHFGSTVPEQYQSSTVPEHLNHCLQGELEVTTERCTGKGKASTAEADIVERVPFLLLALDLPAAPLFKDVLEKNIIPQVCMSVLWWWGRAPMGVIVSYRYVGTKTISGGYSSLSFPDCGLL